MLFPPFPHCGTQAGAEAAELDNPLPHCPVMLHPMSPGAGDPPGWQDTLLAHLQHHPQLPSRAAAGLPGDGCCVFNGGWGCAEAAPLKICRRAGGGCGCGYWQSCADIPGNSWDLLCRLSEPPARRSSRKDREVFFDFFFLIFWIRESWRGLPGSEIILARFLLSCSWPWSLP